MKTIIQNGRVIDPSNKIDIMTDITIENGTISQFGTQKGALADKVIDAKGKWVIPGLVDSQCRPHLQHPHGSTLQEEAKAAVKCGFTSLCIPPDGDLIIDTSANVARLKQQADHLLPHLYPIGALTKHLSGESMTDMSALITSGCVALSQAMHPIKDLSILRHCYEYAASFNLLIVIQPFDAALAKGGIVHEGLVSTQLGMQGIPTIAETIAINQHLQLIEDSGVRAHFTCLSSAKAIEQIRVAKAQGLQVTADCTMHALHLTEMKVTTFDANYHVYPPLRSEADRLGLLAGVKDGTLDAICSDHRPLDSVAKLAPFGDTVPGMSTIDTFIALGLRLVDKEELDLHTLLKAITCNPAHIFNLPAGSLKVGTSADITIIDPHRQFQIADNSLYSSGKNSPYNDWELPNQVMMTLIDGKIVHEC
jgi:dihydroorotase